MIDKELIRKHPILKVLIEISDHVLSFFLWLLFGLLIGLTFNYLFS
tara:strand:+ start:15120 stop:15257 length:138 start_codon:yes stop_codon:yes gene_type:complete